jgi:hypothetical protein
MRRGGESWADRVNRTEEWTCSKNFKMTEHLIEIVPAPARRVTGLSQSRWRQKSFSQISFA